MLKILKCLIIISSCIFALSLFAKSVNAVPIIESINVPMVAATFDSDTMIFKISGLSTVQVFYNDMAGPKPYNALFVLNTDGLNVQVDGSGNSIDYWEGTTTGKIDIISDKDNTVLLSANLLDLGMTVIDAQMGFFSGEGTLEVTDGDLKEEFGNNGGLITVGITFRVPYNFNRPFTAMTNASLYPTDSGNPHSDPRSIPEPSIIFLLGALIIFLGWLERKALKR